jgi:hypothetical protein
MYASVTNLQITPEKVDEMLSTARDIFRKQDLVQRATGLQEVFLVVDRATGKAMSISFWDTGASRNASEGLWREAMSQLADFVVTQPVRQGYDIVEKFEV